MDRLGLAFFGLRAGLSSAVEDLLIAIVAFLCSLDFVVSAAL